MSVRAVRCGLLLSALGLAALTAPGHAGVVNPDISLIGQPVGSWTDDPSDYRNFRRVNFSAGETEIVFDSALNPYARGYATLSLADGQADVEEAYFTLERGLPFGLIVKGGKYRVGFGKLNPQHPHTYPFVERFRVLAKLLPGADGFNETGVDASLRLPAPGDVALTASADVLQGDSFVTPNPVTGVLATDSLAAIHSRPHNAFLGRLSAFVPISDRSGLELGATGTQGTNDEVFNTTTQIYGADLKLKLWTSASANVVIQGEWLGEDRVDHNPTGPDQHWKPAGDYVFANYSWATRYNAGVSFERSTSLHAAASDQAVGAFIGLALMEETTWFRLAYEHNTPAAATDGTPKAPDTNTLRLGLVFSMGPHKAHQF